jgi:hypothetical protein
MVVSKNKLIVKATLILQIPDKSVCFEMLQIEEYWNTGMVEYWNAGRE